MKSIFTFITIILIVTPTFAQSYNKYIKSGKNFYKTSKYLTALERFDLAYEFAKNNAQKNEARVWKNKSKSKIRNQQKELMTAFEKIKVAQAATNKIIRHLNFNENLLPIRGKNNKYGYIDNFGNVVIDFIYDDAFRFSEGFAAVKKNEKFAYITKENKKITKFEFDEAYPFNNGMAIIKKDSLYGYINNLGLLAVKPIYTIATDFNNSYAKVATCYLTYHTKFNEENDPEILQLQHFMFGIIDKKGNTIIPCQFDSINTTIFDTDSFECIKLGEKYNLNSNSIFIEDFQYNEREYLTVKSLKDSKVILKLGTEYPKYAFIDQKNQLISFWFDRVYDFKDGLAKVKLKNKFGFVNSKGKLIIDTYFINATKFKYGKAIVQVNKLSSKFNKNYFAYYINTKGKFLKFYNGKELNTFRYEE